MKNLIARADRWLFGYDFDIVTGVYLMKDLRTAVALQDKMITKQARQIELYKNIIKELGNQL